MDKNERVTPLEVLRKYVAQLGPGPIEGDSDFVASALALCWDTLKGSGQEGMTSDKVYRLEHLTWDPPVLSFEIERHGGTVQCSSRAELHSWAVDIEAATADCSKGKFRQITPNAPRWDAGLAVEMVLEAVREHREESYLQWWGDDFRVMSGEVIPKNSPKQTAAARSKRFRSSLAERLTAEGWQQQGQYWTAST